MRIACALFVLAAGCTNATPVTPMNGDAPWDLLLRDMGDPELPVAEHQRAYAQLLRIQDKAVIPSLIEALGDQRIYNPRQPRQNTLEPEWYVARVGDEAEWALMDLLDARLSYRGAARRDWRAWWRERQRRSLAELRSEARAECDRAERWLDDCPAEYLEKLREYMEKIGAPDR